MSNLSKKVYRFLYYHLAIYLPPSTSFWGCGKYARQFLVKRFFKQVGKNVNIEKGARFGSGEAIQIGDNSGIGINAVIPNNTIIGNDVMMGPNVFVLSRNHKHDRTDIPMREQGYSDDLPLVIEDDVWIGRDVLILPGKTIKKGSIVGAGCVLTKNFPEYSIVGGNPSKLLKKRLDDYYE